MADLFRVEVDFAHNEYIRTVLLQVRKHCGSIIDFDPTGPGGGNPCLLLEFDEERHALEFLMERYPDDTEEFCRSRINKN